MYKRQGETADTLAAIKLAKEGGAFIYGICNSIGSSIARETDTGTYTVSYTHLDVYKRQAQ